MSQNPRRSTGAGIHRQSSGRPPQSCGVLADLAGLVFLAGKRLAVSITLQIQNGIRPLIGYWSHAGNCGTGVRVPNLLTRTGKPAPRAISSACTTACGPDGSMSVRDRLQHHQAGIILEASAAVPRRGSHQRAHKFLGASTWVFPCDANYILFAEGLIVEVGRLHQAVGEDDELVAGTQR